MKGMILFAPLAVLSVSAFAQPPRAPIETGYDPYASSAIERASLTDAEQRLERRLAADSGNVPAMLNLAHVLYATDRPAGALLYYERVLGAENMMLEDLAGEPVWSHDLARRGMALTPAMAAR